MVYCTYIRPENRGQQNFAVSTCSMVYRWVYTLQTSDDRGFEGRICTQYATEPWYTLISNCGDTILHCFWRHPPILTNYIMFAHTQSVLAGFWNAALWRDRPSRVGGCEELSKEENYPTRRRLSRGGALTERTKFVLMELLWRLLWAVSLISVVVAAEGGKQTISHIGAKFSKLARAWQDV